MSWLYHARRMWEARNRAEALSQGQPGKRSRPRSLSTSIMGAGLLCGALGLMQGHAWVLLCGTGLFILGISWALIEGSR